MSFANHLNPFFLSERNKLANSRAHEKEFLEKVRSYHRIVSEQYFDIKVIEKVKQLVPWEELTIDSVTKFSHLESQQPDGKVALGTQDLYLAEIVNWFKNSFFTWFDTGICSNNNCSNRGQKMKLCNKLTYPTREELFYGASRIELYECPSCHGEFRFPRYNHPLKLLDTKTGRCGEWANCLTCICSALGFETRLVLDWTDHVWTEVFSDELKRWVHCDSCENGIDAPLTYEVGWNKKLTYCVAIGKDQVQDVTWRYTNKPIEVLQSRMNLCREQWLTNFLVGLNSSLLTALPVKDRQCYLNRLVCELVELIWIPGHSKTIQADEMQGRASGSAAWRLARAETGGTCQIETNFKFAPTTRDEELGYFEVAYNPVTDVYSYGQGNKSSGWQSCITSAKNVAKKVEHDWKMVYLARNEGSAASESGEILWTMDLSKALHWKSAEITVNGQVYEGATVAVEFSAAPSLTGDHKDVWNPLVLNANNQISKDQLLNNSTGFVVRVRLAGGTGDIAWQRAQLFRHSLVNDKDKAALRIRVNF